MDNISFGDAKANRVEAFKPHAQNLPIGCTKTGVGCFGLNQQKIGSAKVIHNKKPLHLFTVQGLELPPSRSALLGWTLPAFNIALLSATDG